MMTGGIPGSSTKLAMVEIPVSYILKERAQPLAHYPHMTEAGGFLFVSGISARRPDGTVEGVSVVGKRKVRDIRAQTRAVLANLQAVLNAAGAHLGSLVDVTVFLVDMKDYTAFNEVYNTYFEAETGPARTTVGVHELPGPDLLIEIKAIAQAPASPHEDGPGS